MSSVFDVDTKNEWNSFVNPGPGLDNPHVGTTAIICTILMEVAVQTPTRPAYEIAQFYGYLGGAIGKDTRARYDSTVEHTLMRSYRMDSVFTKWPCVHAAEIWSISSCTPRKTLNNRPLQLLITEPKPSGVVY